MVARNDDKPTYMEPAAVMRLGRALADKAMRMLEWPIETTETVSGPDGVRVIITPKAWSLADAEAMLRLGQKLETEAIRAQLATLEPLRRVARPRVKRRARRRGR